jgi:hypothetical protein
MNKNKETATEGRAPWYKDETVILVALRDFKGWTFKEIGQYFNLSRANVCQLYHKWGDWAREQATYSEDLVARRRRRLRE